MFKHILVPTDGTRLSLEAAGRAVAFAGETGARITFLYAERAFPTMYFDEQAPQKFHEQADSMAREILAVAERLAREAGVECATLALTNDEPYKAIIEGANRNGCDLIFMASHGRRGISALLLGSETQKVLTHTKIPVLVYR